MFRKKRGSQFTEPRLEVQNQDHAVASRKGLMTLSLLAEKQKQKKRNTVNEDKTVPLPSPQEVADSLHNIRHGEWLQS